MNRNFHRNLNQMALFVAACAVGVIVWRAEFLHIACANFILNGAIIGVTLFGIGLCFADMFHLLPEYKWMRSYFGGNRRATLPPRILRPVAMMLRAAPLAAQTGDGIPTSGEGHPTISPGTLTGFLEIILNRFEDARESVRYITNTLVFLGLLGTFWGLVTTVGGFAELVGGLDFYDENIMGLLQSGLARPLAGMGIAFTSSLLGLGGSLIVGFLGLQVGQAQNGIFRELEENLSKRTKI